jgi:succinoglycan biosynthesis transport protein ExoP
MVFRNADGPAFGPTQYPDESDDAAYAERRRRVFVLTFALLALSGLVYTLFQPRVYLSSATVLMSAPTAIDRQMRDADIQGLAIQRRTLTGSEITLTLTEVLRRDYGSELDPLTLRSLLDVVPVPDTNLLELTASGADARLLPALVENWIEVYINVRARDIETRKARTLNEVQEEFDGLTAKLEQARSALADYRAEHEIISMERRENAVLAELDGLNRALNNAVEEEVRTGAYLETLRDSLAAGEQPVPPGERREIAEMTRQLMALRARLGELRTRYTEQYIRKDPRLRDVPDQVEKLERELGEALAAGAQAELANAERAYASAREAVADLRRRLDEHKAAVAEFNTIYAKHQALVRDLSRLEELSRETRARLVQIEVRQVEKYPQVSVIDWPAPQARRIGPPYLLLLGGTAALSILGGIFACGCTVICIHAACGRPSSPCRACICIRRRLTGRSRTCRALSDSPTMRRRGSSAIPATRKNPRPDRALGRCGAQPGA